MKTIGIYPGRFQPPHRGHLGVYKQLKQIAGPDTFIATSDKTPTPDSPLNFGEKQQIWVRHGVPSSNIVKVKNTYAPVEITQNFMPDATAAVYALGSKDAERFGIRKKKDEKTGKEIWLKADGSPQYFQPYKGNENDMEPLSKHGYVLIINDITIDGKPISGSNIREALSSPKFTPDQKKKFFQWAFGWYDPSLFQLLVDRFSEASNAKIPPVEKMPSMGSMVSPIKKRLTKESTCLLVESWNRSFIMDSTGKIFDAGQDHNSWLDYNHKKLKGYFFKLNLQGYRDHNGYEQTKLFYDAKPTTSQLRKLRDFAIENGADYLVMDTNSGERNIERLSGEISDRLPPTQKRKNRTISKENLQKIVTEILAELVTPPSTSTPQGPGTVGGMSASQRNAAEISAKKDAVKAKQQAERDLKSLDADLKWKKNSVEKLRKDDLPNKRKELNQLNQQIATGAGPASTL